MDDYIPEYMPDNIPGGHRNFLFRVSVKEHARLNDVALREGRTRTDVLRHALKKYLDSYFARIQAPATLAEQTLEPACGGNGTE